MTSLPALARPEWAGAMRVRRCCVCERATRIGRRGGAREEVARLLLLLSEEGPLKEALLALLSTRGAGEVWGRVGGKFERFCRSCYEARRSLVRGGRLMQREVGGEARRRFDAPRSTGGEDAVLEGQCEVAILAFQSLFVEGTARAVATGIV